MTTYDLNQQADALKQQLAQLEQDKITAAERERQERIDAIADCEANAQAYRNQAAKAATDDDRALLYRYADDAEEQANEIRMELGLVSEEQQQTTNADRIAQEHLAATRKINALFIKALAFFIGYVITDFISDRAPEGLISYLLNVSASILYPLALVFGGVWVVCSLLYSVVAVSGYGSIKRDYSKLNPSARLAILTALFWAILHFLSVVLPHAE